MIFWMVNAQLSIWSMDYWGKKEGNYIIEDIEGNQKELHESELTLYQVEQEPNSDRILKFVEESLFKKREKEDNKTKRKNIKNKKRDI